MCYDPPEPNTIRFYLLQHRNEGTKHLSAESAYLRVPTTLCTLVPQYYTIGTVALYFYDYFLTLEEEVKVNSLHLAL